MCPKRPPATDDTINASKTFTLHKHRAQSSITDMIIGFVISEIIFPACYYNSINKNNISKNYFAKVFFHI